MNPEVLFNDYNGPFYISIGNMVTPLTDIALEPIYTNVVDFAMYSSEQFTIFANALLYESVNFINHNLSFTEKLLLALCLYNFIVYSLTEINLMDKHQKLEDKFETLKNDLNSLHLWTFKTPNKKRYWSKRQPHFLNLFN